MKFKTITFQIPSGRFCSKGKEHCKFYDTDNIYEDLDTGEEEPTGCCNLFNEYLETKKIRCIWVSYKLEECESFGAF